jgi:hypothetical protein
MNHLTPNQVARKIMSATLKEICNEDAARNLSTMELTHYRIDCIEQIRSMADSWLVQLNNALANQLKETV